MPKRKQYSSEDLQAAVSAVKQSRLTRAEASREFHIPRKTIDDCIAGRWKKHTHGPSRMLSEEEESTLVAYIKYMQDQGFPMTRTFIRRFVVAIVKKSNKATLFNLEKGPSDDWFRKFLARHPELSERDSEFQDRARSRMANETTVNNYFQLLQDNLDKLGLNDKPGQIFNCDETGFSGKEKPKEKVIGQKGKHCYQQALFASCHTTLHMCIAADGRVLPSMIIFEKCLPHIAYKDGVPGNWLFGFSESGYMDSHLFLKWFKELFIPNCGKARPVALIMDNHDSHINLDIIKLARENMIELIGLPPHTTHYLQPLDVGVNGPLKAKLNTIALNGCYLNTNQTITKAKFPTLISYAIDQFCSPANIKSAFRKSGLFPIDKEAIDKSQIAKAKFSKPSSSPEATSASNTTANRSSHTCDKCGSFVGGNPLVAEGLVPPALAEIFLPVSTKSLTTRSKCITDARVISSDEFYNSLLSKCQEKEKKAQEMAKRKEEREEKRKLKEETRKTKEKSKSKKKSNKKISNEDEDEEAEDVDDGLCEECHQVDPPNGTSDDVVWVSCDKCEAWVHLDCVGLQGEEVADTYFICSSCLNSSA